MDHIDSYGNQEVVLTIKLDAWAISSYGLNEDGLLMDTS